MSDRPEGHVPYRPSNGTEGDIFQAMWCAHCAKRGGPDIRGGDVEEMDYCDILAWTMALEIDDPGYPEQWRQDGPSGPRCTAFDSGDGIEPIDPAAAIRPLL